MEACFVKTSLKEPDLTRQATRKRQGERGGDPKTKSKERNLDENLIMGVLRKGGDREPD